MDLNVLVGCANMEVRQKRTCARGGKGWGRETERKREEEEENKEEERQRGREGEGDRVDRRN